MKVLITGGAGYIGSVLSEMLIKRGHSVVILDRFFFGRDVLKNLGNKVKLIKDDVRFSNPSDFNGIDAVIDMAALSNDPSGELDKKTTLEINYLGRKRTATISKRKGVRKYVLASSCSVYGFNNELVDERSKVNPLTTYAKANILAEKATFSLADRGFSVTALRQATVYGLSPRMRFDLAINNITLQFFEKRETNLNRYGKQWRPFIHVKDTASAFISVIEENADVVNKEIFNVGSNEQNYQIINVAKIISSSIHMPFRKNWVGEPDTRNYRVNFDKIRNTLGFKPRFTPKEGAKEIYNALSRGEISGKDPRTITVEWYKNLIKMQQVIKDIELNGFII